MNLRCTSVQWSQTTKSPFSVRRGHQWVDNRVFRPIFSLHARNSPKPVVRRGCANPPLSTERGRGSRAATFGVVLDVDTPELLGFTLQSGQVGQNRLAQAHAGCSRQLRGGRGARAEHVDDPLHVFAVLALRYRATNTDAPHSQRLARTLDLHMLITAKRSQGPVHAGRPVLRGGDG